MHSCNTEYGNLAIRSQGQEKIPWFEEWYATSGLGSCNAGDEGEQTQRSTVVP